MSALQKVEFVDNIPDCDRTETSDRLEETTVLAFEGTLQQETHATLLLTGDRPSHV